MNSNQLQTKYPSLWALCAQVVHDTAGRQVPPAPNYYIPRAWLRTVSQAASAARQLERLLPRAQDREDFLIGDQDVALALTQAQPALAPLHKVLSALVEGGALQSAFQWPVSAVATATAQQHAVDPHGRHYAIRVAGTVVTFQCATGLHEYTVDWGQKPVSQRMGPTGVRLLAAWWDRAHGGVTAPPCAQCWPGSQGASPGVGRRRPRPGTLGRPARPAPDPRRVPRRPPPLRPGTLGNPGPEG